MCMFGCRIKGDVYKIHFLMCRTALQEPPITNQPIPEYYSYRHAIDKGWIITTDWNLCPECKEKEEEFFYKKQR